MTGLVLSGITGTVGITRVLFIKIIPLLINSLQIKDIISFIVVAMNSRDRYKIIELCKISHSIKQPRRRACLKKASEMHQSC